MGAALYKIPKYIQNIFLDVAIPFPYLKHNVQEVLTPYFHIILFTHDSIKSNKYKLTYKFR